MGQDISEEGEYDELEKLPGEAEARPIMAILHDLKTIPLEIRRSIKVHLTEGLKGHSVPAIPFRPVHIVLKRHVVFNWSTWQSDLFISGRTTARRVSPVSHEDWKKCDQAKNNSCFHTTAN